MELMKNLQWICRVCTVNIKKRRSLLPVHIFETAQLCEKLKKYLHLEIDPNDELPKKICGNCYRKIETFHKFSSLAARSDIFLKDFLNIAKGNVLGIRTPQAINDKFQKEFASFALLAGERSKQNESIQNDDLPVNDAGELILNVSVNDPLIKDIENKIDLATKRRSLEIEHRKIKRGNSSTKNVSSSSGSNNIGKDEKGGGGGKKRDNEGGILVTQNKSKSLSGNFLKSNNNQNINNGNQLTQQQRTYSDGNFSGQLSPLDSKKLLQQQQLQLQQQLLLDQQQLPSTAVSASYDSLNLGSVIKDMDLLKLILKALKWPYTRDNLGLQLQQLKNTRLRDVITDPNLLQDADMTQILRSYLSPVLLQSHNNNTSALNIMNSTVAAMNTLSSIVSYKIPADTSVQLISVPSTEVNNTNYQGYNYNHNLQHQQQQQEDNVTSSIMRTSKSHRMSSPSPIVLSDDSNDNDNGVQLFEVSVDPRLYFPGDKEFFFHQYNNTDSLSDNSPNSKPATSNTENPKTRVRKKQRKTIRRETLRNNMLKYKRNASGRRQTQKQQKKQQQQQQQQLQQQQLLQKAQQQHQHHQQQQQQQQQQDVIVIDDNPPIENPSASSASSTTGRNNKQQKSAKPTKIIQDEGFKDFNIDSITLIEEASGDDEIWAEFKVTESPDNSDTENHNKEMNVKKEAVDDIEISSTIKPIDKENDKNEGAVNNKTAGNSKKETQNEELSNKITEKESSITSDTENILVENEIMNDEPTKRKYTRKSVNQKSKNYPTSSRVTRPKSPRNYFNKRKQNNAESKRLRLESDNKKEEKSTEKEQETTVVSSRKSNARKRICKQCGLTFTNITDFVEHRKKHM